MKERIGKIIENELNLPSEWNVHASFTELGAQSIQMMKIQMSILKEFGVRLSFQELFQNQTVDQLRSCLEKKQVAG